MERGRVEAKELSKVWIIDTKKLKILKFCILKECEDKKSSDIKKDNSNDRLISQT